MLTLDRLTYALSRLLMGIAMVALFLMMAQMVVDVAMRNFFRAPIEGSLEIVSVYHMVAVVFLPLALVERRHEHITVDLLVERLPAIARRIIMVAGYIVCAIFFGLLTYQTAKDAMEAYAIGEILMSSIYITVWPAKFLLPIGFFVMLLQVLLHVWKAANDPAFTPSPESPDAANQARN
jgi:TRAP-type C4-dicarboxylate transport system permease small subunit